MRSAKPTILFIRIWQTPPIAASVERMLRCSFPEFRVETCDISALLKRRPDVVARGLFNAGREYGRAVLSRRMPLRVAFYFTSYLFREVRRLLQHEYRRLPADLACTFQLQSIFDASFPGVPHFVYTDNTAAIHRRCLGNDGAVAFSAAWLALEPEIYQRATAVLTRSENVTRSLICDYGCSPSRVTQVYVGCNVPVGETSDDLARYQRQEILFVGSEWERKGGPELVRAFQRLRGTHPGASLTVVGCSPNVALPGCVVLGPLPVSEIAALYQRASIFCLPTRAEPFGVAFIEAMAHRLPIVATGIDPIPEFVRDGENGILVPSRDERALACALERLAADPRLCQHLGAAGYALYRERYNWESVGERVRTRVLADLREMH